MVRTVLSGRPGNSLKRSETRSFAIGRASAGYVLANSLASADDHVRSILPWLVAGAALAGVAILVALASGDLGAWIGDKAHMLGHALDRSVASVAHGDAGAWTALLGGSALYGFLHALGPGHGKVLVGGVGAGSSVTARRLMGLSLAASLVQALWAIMLVYGALAAFDLSVGAVTGLARDVLGPLGAAFIAGIGALMLWRTAIPIARAWRRGRTSSPQAHMCGHAHHDRSHAHDHGHHEHRHDCSHHHRDHHRGGHHDAGEIHDHQECSCAHAPTFDAVGRLERPWDAVTLIAGIAVRPCTSALVVLALAWQMGIPLAGAMATLVMGLGTAVLVCLVAGSSVLARRMALISSSGSAISAHLALRLAASSALVLLGLAMAVTTL